MAFLADLCLKAIMKNDMEEFELLLQCVKELIIGVREIASMDVKWVQDIPLLCTLYNNHRFIKKVHEYLKFSCSFKSSCSLGNEVSVLVLARALRVHKCIKHLENLYGKCRDEGKYTPVVADFNVFAGILNVWRLYRMEPNIVIQNFKRLVENGLDISARGPGRRTILHEAVLKMCSYEIHKTLFSLGCDVNTTDDIGATAFVLFIWKVYHYKGRYEEIVKILKLFLYENPDISLNVGVIKKAINYDRMRFPDDEDVSDDNTSDSGHEHYTNQHVHQKEHLRLLPWLYKGGFRISQSDRDTVELPSLFTCRVTYNIQLNRPRSLKDIARTVIRASYPGRKLHEIVSEIVLPASICDYILLKEFISEC